MYLRAHVSQVFKDPVSQESKGPVIVRYLRTLSVRYTSKGSVTVICFQLCWFLLVVV